MGDIRLVDIDEAIAFARGDTVKHLTELLPRDKDIAELGCRRLISFLAGRKIFTVVDKPIAKDQDKPMSAACSNCSYWRTGSEPSQCLRHVPVPLAGQQWGQWPLTRPQDWCGEYEPAREHVEEPE